MKRKILAVATIMLLVTVSCVAVANETTEKEETESECSLCEKLQDDGFRPLCRYYGMLYGIYSSLERYHEKNGHPMLANFWHYYAEALDCAMAVLNCPNEPAL